MLEMRALIDDREYFDRIMYYYQMFSFDTAYNGDDISIEPSKVGRVSTRSIADLLQALAQFGQRGDKNFLIATHGNPDGLPIRIRPNSGATLNSDFMDALTQALGADAATRRAGRAFAMSYRAGRENVFSNEGQLDALLQQVRNVRSQRLGRLEFRGCNIGAGPALRSLHELLGAEITAAPTVQFMWARIATARYRTIDAAPFATQLARLPAGRRTFTRSDCYRGISPDDEDVIAIAIAGRSIELIARSTDMIKGWTQAYLQDGVLFAIGREPAGGGYRPGRFLPLVGFLTPNGRQPFVFPGDGPAYTDCLAYEMQPAHWVP